MHGNFLGQSGTSHFLDFYILIYNFFDFFYKITPGKQKRGNNLFYQGINYPEPPQPYCFQWCMKWHGPSYVFHTVIETWGQLQKHSLAIVFRNQWLNWFP